LDCRHLRFLRGLGVAGRCCAGIFARHTRAEALDGLGAPGLASASMCPFAGRGTATRGTPTASSEVSNSRNQTSAIHVRPVRYSTNKGPRY
jgi:hypothetical protein